ncbi:MAG: flagellar hook-associated protein FlgK [Fimbriimonadaceae bacterium]|nr:flagellar hook-associated protein FlgK [Fimbriimonadaceae bacterium]
MSGSFQGISIASTALRNFQLAVNTVGHNIANVNTPGYSRQRVDLRTSVPTTFFQNGRQAYGTGVSLAGISRARDLYLEQRSRTLQGDLGRASTLASTLSAVEGVFQEPSDNGISNALGKFFDGWSALGSRPDDPAARAQVRQAGQVLTDRIRTAARDLATLSAANQGQLSNAFDQIDRLAGQIAQLNNEIREFAGGSGSPNDLMDQRDLAVQQLSELVDVRVENLEDGTYSVYTAGFTLVEGARARNIPRTVDAATSSLTYNGGSYPIRGGVLAGLLQTTAAINVRSTELDSLANELRTQINTLHTQGLNNGVTGINFFDPAANGAMGFDLSTEVKASSSNVMSSVTGNASDGGLALGLASLRESTWVALGNRSFDGYYEAAVNQAATEANYYAGAQDTVEAMLVQVTAQQESVSGVSIDEEMAEMVKMQRSYQAAARALTVFDQMTEDVINMLRR